MLVATLAVILGSCARETTPPVPTTVEGFRIPDDGRLIAITRTEPDGRQRSVTTVFTNESREDLLQLYSQQVNSAGGRNWRPCSMRNEPQKRSWVLRALSGDRTLELTVGSSGARSRTKSYVALAVEFDQSGGSDCPSATS